MRGMGGRRGSCFHVWVKAMGVGLSTVEIISCPLNVALLVLRVERHLLDFVATAAHALQVIYVRILEMIGDP